MTSPVDAPAAALTEQEAAAHVLDAWRRELGAETDPNRGFIDSGGTSLPAVRVAGALRSATGRAISPMRVLHASSVYELAELLRNAPRTAPADGPQARGRTSGPLSPNQAEMWLHDQITGGGRRFARPLCFVLPPSVDRERLADAVARASRAHPAFGASTEAGADGVRLVLDRHEIRLGFRTLPYDPDRDLRLDAVEQLLDRPFTTTGGALSRAVLIADGGRPDLLVLVWHDLVIDGWSMRLFLEDLGACYQNPAAQPAAPATTLCDVGHWLDELVLRPETQQRIEQAARGLGPIAAVPDRHPEAADEPVQALAVRLAPEDTRRLRKAGRGIALPPSAVLYTAYQHALAEVLGVDEFVLGCIVAGRDEPALHRIAGLLSNTVLLRVGHTARPGLDTVRATRWALERAAAESERIPVAAVAGHLRAGRAPIASGPIPQFVFGLDEETVLQLGGVACQEHAARLTTASFDANLVLRERQDEFEGFFEHRPTMLDRDEAKALADLFVETVKALTEQAESLWNA